MYFVPKLVFASVLTFALAGCLRAHYEGAYDREPSTGSNPGPVTGRDEGFTPDAGQHPGWTLRDDAGATDPTSCLGCSGSLVLASAQVLNKYCSSCHGPQGTAAGVFHTPIDVSQLVESGLVIPDDPDGSPLWQRMANGSMPPPGSLQPSPDEQGTVYAWIGCGAEDWNGPAPLKPHYSYPYESCEPAQERIGKIFGTYCASCHGPDSPAEGGFGVVMDAELMQRQHWVVPNEPENSRVYQRLIDGTMPPEGAYVIGMREIEMVLGWIQCGAKDWNLTPDAPPADAGISDSGAVEGVPLDAGAADVALDAGVSAPGSP